MKVHTLLKINLYRNCRSLTCLFQKCLPRENYRTVVFYSDKKPCKDDPVLVSKEKEVCKKDVPDKCQEKKGVKVLPVKFPAHALPKVDPPVGPGECLRPYTNPCPPYPPCDPRLVPVHPCREKPVRVLPQREDLKEELSPRARAVLLALSGLFGSIYIFHALTSKEKTSEKRSVRPRCVLRPEYVTKVPNEPVSIPTETKYLIVGGGTAAFSAFRTIKNLDPSAKILIVTDEAYSPYMRPPLTKDLLSSEDRELSKQLKFKSKKVKGKPVDQSIYFEPEEFFTPVKDFSSVDNGISIVKGWKVEKIDIEKKSVKILEGGTIKYDKCLLTTGAKPEQLSVFEFNTEDVQKKVTTFRNVYDYLEVEDVINCGAETIGVIGGTSRACEIACALAKRGIKVIQITDGEHLMDSVFPCYLSKVLTKKIEEGGVKVMEKVHIEDAVVVNKKLKLITKDRKSILLDHAVVASGTKANTCLAEASGIETDCKNGGFVVNPEMQIRTDLYAAGDCASFYHPLLGRRRIENHDHAMVTGRIAGENMVGGKSWYQHESLCWSDVAPNIEVESIGVIDSKLPTVGVFLDKDLSLKKDKSMSESPADPNNEYNRGLIYYLRNKKVVGILFWNVLGRSVVAQSIFERNINYDELDDVTKLFNIIH